MSWGGGKGGGSYGGKGGGMDIRSLQNASGDDSGREVFLKYLPSDAKESELKEFFSDCGEIVGEPKLMREPATGRVIRGFVVFKTDEGFNKALSWSGSDFGGRNLVIEPATTRATAQSEGTHSPGLWKEVLRDLVEDDPDGTYVDGTFGRGGHTRLILGALSPKGRLHAFDMDPVAIEFGRALEKEDSRFTIHHAPFSSMEKVLGPDSGSGVEPIAGILLDVGISSPQLDGARGFKPEFDGELDMRFDVSEGRPTAWDMLQCISRPTLARVLREYGGENRQTAQRIADAIILAREKGDPATGEGGIPKRTLAFAALVTGAKGREYQLMHPAKLTFQALRILVNEEFDEMRRGMYASFKVCICV
jgi:16S rRNA (cytosine1402-N4)-methyltransferase